MCTVSCSTLDVELWTGHGRCLPRPSRLTILQCCVSLQLRPLPADIAVAAVSDRATELYRALLAMVAGTAISPELPIASDLTDYRQPRSRLGVFPYLRADPLPSARNQDATRRVARSAVGAETRTPAEPIGPPVCSHGVDVGFLS